MHGALKTTASRPPIGSRDGAKERTDYRAKELVWDGRPHSPTWTRRVLATIDPDSKWPRTYPNSLKIASASFLRLARLMRDVRHACRWPARGLFFARPSFCHCLVGDKPKVSTLPIRPHFDVVDDNLHPLQVGRAFRRAKQLGVVIQRVEDFDGPHASPGEETGIGSKKILAASYVKVGAVGPGNGLGHCGDWREQDCKESGGGNS
jgi:hypothetical protein